MQENSAMSAVCLPFDAEGKGLLHICLTFKADLIYENIALPLPPFSVQSQCQGSVGGEDLGWELRPDASVLVAVLLRWGDLEPHST